MWWKARPCSVTKVTKGQAGARRVALTLALCLPLLGSTPAHAQEGPIDLLGQFDYRFDGAEANHHAGENLDGAGDVNNDGTNDFVIGAPIVDLGGDDNVGQAYVVFGLPSSSTTDLGSLGTQGFVMDGVNAQDQAGASVAGVGDVNNDGLDDIAVGASQADNNGRGTSGSVYIVFGKTSTTPVDLSALGAGGFRIDGAAAFDQIGREETVEAAGDVNNDGLDDIVLGSNATDNNTRQASGSAYVVFGKTTTTNVDLAALGAGGFRIDGAAEFDWLGYSVAGGADVNDDGKSDVIVGAPETDYNSRTSSGSAYVVFGKTTTTNIDLASLGAGGFRIDGAAASADTGRDVAMPRNVNNDAYADLIVGASSEANNGRSQSGSTYVVFGKSTTTNIDLASLGTGGFRIDGEEEFDLSGESVAPAGDVNNDGRSDVILGAKHADNNEREESGSAYVVFGKITNEAVDLASLGTSGYRIDGPAPFTLGATSVSGVGDLNGDDLADVMVGVRGADTNGESSGAAYIDLAGDWLAGACANPRPGSGVDDTIIGIEVGEDIGGGAGADEIEAGGGEDCADGEAGSDTVKGGTENDTVEGGDGADDSVTGGDGDDTVLGGEGADESVTGGEGADTVDGGVGNDESVVGGDGDDTVLGDDGEDTLDGEAGVDDIEGGGEADTATGGDNGDDIEGEGGADTLEGDAGQDTILGGESGDTLKGGTEGDTLKGEDGEDTLKGQDGQDTLKGGAKDDTLTGGDGKDTIESGGGDDTINANDGEKDTIDCGGGNDTVNVDNKDVLTSC